MKKFVKNDLDELRAWSELVSEDEMRRSFAMGPLFNMTGQQIESHGMVGDENRFHVIIKNNSSMNHSVIKAFILALVLAFTVYVSAQHYKLEGSFTGSDKIPNLTLIRLSDDSIVWKGETDANGAFSIMGKSDDYALCATTFLSFDTVYHEAIIPVKLTSDTEIGQVTMLRSVIDSLYYYYTIFYISDENSGTGFSFERQRDISRHILRPPIKGYGMKTILYESYFLRYNFRIDEKSNHAPKLIVDDELVEMNFTERMDLLKNMSAQEVKFYEKIPPSETFPGGVIRIVTTAYREPETLPEGFYKIRGRLEDHISIDLIQDNTVVWTSSACLKEDDSLGFSVNIEKGDYVLVIPYPKKRAALYIQVNLCSDTDLGDIVRTDSVSVEEDLKKSYERQNWDKMEVKTEDYSLKTRSIKHTPGPVFKKYDVLRLLNSLGFYNLQNKDLRGLINSEKLATIKIDGVAIEKDFADLITYLRSLPAKDVEYVETFLATEESPGGIINIVTTSGIQ